MIPKYSVFIGANAVMSGVSFGQANAFLKTYVTVLNLADKLSPFAYSANVDGAFLTCDNTGKNVGCLYVDADGHFSIKPC